MNVGDVCKKGHILTKDTITKKGQCKTCISVKLAERKGEVRKKTCSKGHLRSPENIDTQGHCIICNRERQKMKRQQAEYKVFEQQYNNSKVIKITNSYIASCLRTKVKLLSPNTLELKRSQIILTRLHKELSNELKRGLIND